MRVTVPNLDSLPVGVRSALESIVGRINTVFQKQHTGDGLHTVVTLAAVTTPAAPSTGGTVYVDSADGDLKVIFANGTIKTIATN